MRLIIRKTLLMFLLLSLSNVLTGFQLSAQEQNKKFSVKADNVTLKEAIEVVRKQGNYSFLIRNNDIDLNKKVSVNVDKGTINDVMAQLLTGTGISYEVNGNRVVIFHAAVPEKEQGKAFVLKGKVTDPSGEGVIVAFLHGLRQQQFKFDVGGFVGAGKGGHQYFFIRLDRILDVVQCLFQR